MAFESLPLHVVERVLHNITAGRDLAALKQTNASLRRLVGERLARDPAAFDVYARHIAARRTDFLRELRPVHLLFQAYLQHKVDGWVGDYEADSDDVFWTVSSKSFVRYLLRADEWYDPQRRGAIAARHYAFNVPTWFRIRTRTRGERGSKVWTLLYSRNGITQKHVETTDLYGIPEELFEKAIELCKADGMVQQKFRYWIA